MCQGYLLQRLFPFLPEPCLQRIISGLLGSDGCTLETEKIISLALTPGLEQQDMESTNSIARMNISSSESHPPVALSELLDAYFDKSELADYRCRAYNPSPI